MIDRATGDFRFNDLPLSLGPGLSREAFLASPLGAQASVSVQNEPHCSFKIILSAGAARFVVVLWFRGSRLVQVALQIDDRRYGTSWAEWSEAAERERQQAHEAWLRTALDRPPYRFPWGTVESVYDARDGASQIVVRYAGQHRP